MKEKIINPLVILATLIIALLALAISSTNFIQKGKEKIVFINNTEVYESFKGKQVLEQKLRQNVEGQKNFLDSLQLVIASMDPEKDKDFSTKVELFNKVNQNYQVNVENQRGEYINQALNQINIYVEEYAKEKGYDYIIGNTGAGNIVFAKDKVDKTKEVISYVNSKYEGF